jgi:hypothetical protein
MTVPNLDLLKSVKMILLDEPTYLTEFETQFRETVTATDMDILLAGKIPNKIIYSAFSHSLQYVSSQCFDQFERTQNLKYNTIAQQLWNPLVAASLKILQQTDIRLQVEINAMHSKTSSLRKNGSQQKELLPKTKKKKPDVVKKLPPAPLLETELKRTIVEDLTHHRQKESSPFCNAKHVHINCKRIKCDFCESLYQQVNLTPCVDHKPCVNSGWFPHVGKTLWSMMRQAHQQKRDLRHKTRECKPHELPCLLDLQGEVPVNDKTNFPPLPEIATMNISADLPEDVEQPGFSWCDEVEEERPWTRSSSRRDHAQTKRAKRSISRS